MKGVVLSVAVITALAAGAIAEEPVPEESPVLLVMGQKRDVSHDETDRVRTGESGENYPDKSRDRDLVPTGRVEASPSPSESPSPLPSPPLGSDVRP